jgi:hypothetical protein
VGGIMSELKRIPLRWSSAGDTKIVGTVLIDQEALKKEEPIVQRLGASIASDINTGEIIAIDIFQHEVEEGLKFPVQSVTKMDEHEVVWFMGPVNGPGFYMLRSDKPGMSRHIPTTDYDRSDSGHRPPRFPWNSMDRKWMASGQPQGTVEMNWRRDWSVLSVADYTQDSRPNVMVSFAVEREKVSKEEMKTLAAERYPSIWKRLGVKDG